MTRKLKRGDTMDGSYYCGACKTRSKGWRFVGIQTLINGEGTLADCPKCHSSRIVGEVRE